MTILHIDSSIQGDQSASRILSAAVVERLLEERGDVVAYRDLAADPVPHLTIEDMGTLADNPELAEFLVADTIVIGAPLYNFGIPSQLKAWLDRIFVAGKTFTYNEDGPVGLISGKRVILAIARGGLYSAGMPWAALEHAESYLRGGLGFIGITDIEVILAEGLKLPDNRDVSIGRALEEARGLALAA